MRGVLAPPNGGDIKVAEIKKILKFKSGCSIRRTTDNQMLCRPTNNYSNIAGFLRERKMHMASDPILLNFTKKPSSMASYVKLITGKRKGLKPGESLPLLQGRCAHMGIDPLNLQKYNHLCGLKDSQHLPLLYPHILAAPLHLSMVSHSAFPLKMMGSIHLSNHILQHRSIGRSERLDIECSLGAKRNVEKGLEFDTLTVTEPVTIWQIKGLGADIAMN